MEDRLLQLTQVGSGILDGLFAATLSEVDRRQLLAEAYRLQARRKAFRLPTGEMLSSPAAHEEEADSV
jgi:hypothetical protein